MCKSWCELIIGLIIAIFALFVWKWNFSRWVILIAALVLIVHSFMCKSCWCCCGGECKMHGKKETMSKPTKSKKK